MGLLEFISMSLFLSMIGTPIIKYARKEEEERDLDRPPYDIVWLLLTGTLCVILIFGALIYMA